LTEVNKTRYNETLEGIMHIEYFTEAQKLFRKGSKNESFECLEKFIASFENDTEKEQWVKEYLTGIKLPKEKDGGQKKFTGEFIIGVFKKIIAPVLINGVNRKDVLSMLWAYKLSVNFDFYYGNYYKEMIYTCRWRELLIDLYKFAPENNEVEILYFKTRVRQIKSNVFNNSRIYDNWNPDYARGYSIEDCQKDLEEVKLLKSIDRDKEYFEFLNKYEDNLNKLKEKITK
jgi:hypothetical protein